MLNYGEKNVYLKIGEILYKGTELCAALPLVVVMFKPFVFYCLSSGRQEAVYWYDFQEVH